MEFRKRKLWIFLFIVIILLTSKKFFSYKDKLIIKRTVTNNLELLNRIVENEDYEEIHNIIGIRDIRSYPLEGDGIYIEFFCKGYGIVSNSVYKGFYYTSSGQPIGFQASQYQLEEKGRAWTWREDKGDNWYYTEKIVDNWYYYEAGF